MQMVEGDKIIARGIFSKYEGGDFERNSISIIDRALVIYFLKGTKPNRTIMEAYKNDELEKFQSIVKYGSFDGDRKSTRLNSSHVASSYAVLCLKIKKEDITEAQLVTLRGQNGETEE